MKTIDFKFPNLTFVFVFMMLISLILTSCAQATTDTETVDLFEDVPVNETENLTTSSQDSLSEIESENTPEITEEQQIEVMIPMIESGGKEYYEDENAYPDPEQELQDSSGPEPEQSKSDAEATEEPTQVIKPTPRGNKLVATDPSTVNLASGSLQLVEMFAFW